MALNITVENSCKFFVIRGRQYDPTSTQGEINIPDLDTNATTTHIMAWDVNGRGRINVPTDSIPAKYGAFKVCLEELGIEYACKPILIHCDIDCCLAKLTNELIDCACDCPKCSSAFANCGKISVENIILTSRMKFYMINHLQHFFRISFFKMT